MTNEILDFSEEQEETFEQVIEEPVSREEQKKILEAALFMAPKSMHAEEIIEHLGFENERELLKLARELKEDYEAKDSSLEITINEDDLTFNMRVKVNYIDKVKHLASEAEFHKGMQKTLALIAYKQPIKQSLVIKYRNNKAYDHIKLLEEKDLIQRNKVGRTYVLRTTKKFLEYFGDIKQKMKK